jgi:uncharacterized protein HemX
MKRHRIRALVLAVVAVVAVGSSIYAWAQQQAQPAQPNPPRGRLPAYYGQVVNQQQREQIYAIQAKYNARIAELQKQLADLRAQRDAEIEKVLTPEQLKRIQQLRAQAAEGSGSPPSSGTAPPAGTAPPTGNPPSSGAAPK